MGRSLEIFVCAGDMAADYMAILRRSMIKYASGSFDLVFKCIINTKQFTSVDGWEVVEVDPTYETTIYPKANGSHNHARQLNKIHKYVTTDLAIICDADVCLLRQNWDQILASKMGKK